jgi:hypothetical protein
MNIHIYFHILHISFKFHVLHFPLHTSILHISLHIMHIFVYSAYFFSSSAYFAYIFRIIRQIRRGRWKLFCIFCVLVLSRPSLFLPGFCNAFKPNQAVKIVVQVKWFARLAMAVAWLTRAPPPRAGPPGPGPPGCRGSGRGWKMSIWILDNTNIGVFADIWSYVDPI